VALTVARGEEKLDVAGAFPKFTPSPIYRRSTPTAEFALQSEGNRVVVRARNVRRFRLRLHSELFGDGAIALAVNGQRIEPKIRELSLEEIVRNYAREADAGRVHGRDVTVDIP